MPFPVKLVCPRCRVVGPDGKLVLRYLAPGVANDSDTCAGCGTVYPIVDGIRCVPPDPEEYLAPQSYALDPRWPLIYGDPQTCADALAAAANLDPASSEFRETLLPAVYALAHYPRSIQNSDLKQELI